MCIDCAQICVCPQEVSCIFFFLGKKNGAGEFGYTNEWVFTGEINIDKNLWARARVYARSSQHWGNIQNMRLCARAHVHATGSLHVLLQASPIDVNGQHKCYHEMAITAKVLVLNEKVGGGGGLNKDGGI